MSGFVVDFEVLPPDTPGQPDAAEVLHDLGRQLHSRSGSLFRGDMARYFDRATLEGEAGRAPSIGSQGPSGADRQAQILRDLAETAGGEFGQPHPHYHMDRMRSSLPQERIEQLDRELREARETQRADFSRAQRADQRLKEREQLLVHAKEMWMKESARASKLADALTTAQERLVDQEKRLQELGERYSDASHEVRQLRHLLGSPESGGIFGSTVQENGYAWGAQGRQTLQDSGHALGSTASGLMPPVTVDMVTAPPTNDKGVMFEPAAGMSYPATLPQRSEHGPRQPANPAVMPPPVVEADSNTERFRHLCMTNDGILTEDEMLQVGIKAEYQGVDGQIAIYFGNKAGVALHAFSVHHFVKDDAALKFSVSSVGHQLEPMTQVVQRVTVHLVAPFVEPPSMRVQYLLPDASPRRLTLRFPMLLTKFMRGRELTQEEFFRIWRDQRFVQNEVTSVVNLAHRFRSALMHIARALSLGGAMRLHQGFDTNPSNFVLVSQLVATLPAAGTGASLSGSGVDAESSPGLSLVRVETGSGRFSGRARVAIRSNDQTVARGLCESILLQLIEPQTSGVDSQTAVLVR